MMNTDKAYILGLVVGGGCFGTDNNSFYIKLPYKQWGDVQKNPARAGVIARDILKVVAPLMRIEYDLNVLYVTEPEWRIECVGDISKLKQDLIDYGINPVSEIRKNADISGLVSELIDDNMKRRFIAGIADTIGSMAPSHRRFTDDVQTISFEVNGFAFMFVCQLCNLLYSIGCLPDQILWQQPNMQSGNDAYYTQWKKGNKLRVTLDTFSQFGALAFKSKSVSSQENRKKQSKTNVADKCENKAVVVSGVTAKHIDENFTGLPDIIRGGHYIHHKQICAALGCPHAPYAQIDRILDNAEMHISPFAVLHKDTLSKVNNIILNDEIMKNRVYRQIDVVVKNVIDAMGDGNLTMHFTDGGYSFSTNARRGYPINYILDAMAYVIASQQGKLHGKRVRGSRDEMLTKAIKEAPLVTISFNVPDLLTPVIVSDGVVAAMVGPLNADVYRTLISFAPENKYKMLIRTITEEDLRG